MIVSPDANRPSAFALLRCSGSWLSAISDSVIGLKELAVSEKRTITAMRIGKLGASGTSMNSSAAIGAPMTMNGVRLPQRLRVRSLNQPISGCTKMPMMLSSPMIRPISATLVVYPASVTGVCESWKFHTDSWAKIPSDTSRARRSWKRRRVGFGLGGVHG